MQPPRHRLLLFELVRAVARQPRRRVVRGQSLCGRLQPLERCRRGIGCCAQQVVADRRQRLSGSAVHEQRAEERALREMRQRAAAMQKMTEILFEQLR